MRILRVLVVVLVSSWLAACATTPPVDSFPVMTNGEYTLDTGDVLRVQVYGDEELSNSYRIDGEGNIAFPLIGSVQVRGGSTQVAAARIAAELANGYLRQPEVTVEVEEYRPFFIQGAVVGSGQYPYVFGMTVRAAVSTAGGYTETANRSRVTIYRQRGQQTYEQNVGLDFPVYPGDTIVVPENWL